MQGLDKSLLYFFIIYIILFHILLFIIDLTISNIAPKYELKAVLKPKQEPEFNDGVPRTMQRAL